MLRPMAAQKTRTKPAAKKTPTTKKTAAKKAAAPAAKRMTAKVSPLKGMSVDAYIAEKVTGWQADAARRLVALVRKVAPDAVAVVKWSQPVFELNGPFAYLKPAKAHLTFGFWRGADLADPKKLLSSGERMSHVKLTSADQVDEAALGALVRQAVKLNRNEGDPTKRGK
jgi:hypothetical protein